MVWVNTGAAFPETLEQMQRVRELVPHFHEVRGRQNIETDGYPVDVLPVASTSLGARFERGGGRRFQSRYSCCAAALWSPMREFMKSVGATVVIRGEKRCDRRRSGLEDGVTVEGIEFRFPLFNWTDADVFAYLKEHGIALPPNYGPMRTGLDCMNCTAYLDESGKLEYLRAHHPDEYALVHGVLRDYRRTLETELARLP